MDFLKSCLMDWISYSIWESIIFYLFITKVGKLKCKRIDCLLLSVLFCLSSFLILPTIRQIVCIILIITYLFIIRKNDLKLSIRYTLYEYIMITICESIFYISLKLTYSLIYAKILEIVIIIILSKGENMKQFWGEIKKRKVKIKKNK